MKAIAVVAGTPKLELVDRPEPHVAAPDQVKLKVLQVGVCGTDREEAAGGRALAPAGSAQLVLGHEMLGRVVEVGKDVCRVKPGDHAVFTVRRGCGGCLPCAMNRPDMCRTGRYQERGIWGLDGYQTEFVVDAERYVVRVPPEISGCAVLTEPLTIAEKAIDEAVRVQTARLPDAPAAAPEWLHGRRCLVAGLGPVGLLAAAALRLRGAEVFGLDVVDVGTARPKWLSAVGGQYIDGRKVTPDKVEPNMDLIFEATGVARLEFDLLEALAPDGVYVLTGIPGGERPVDIPGAKLVRELVLDNQAMIGSVNAARGHFQAAVDDRARANRRWPGLAERLITHRHPYTDFEPALRRHPAEEIKTVIEWAAG